MIVKKGIEIKLYPNKAQKVFFAKTFGCCRFVYNQCIKLKSYLYEETYMSFDPNAACNILEEGIRILNNEGTPRTGETAVLLPLRLADDPPVDDRPLDLKSSGQLKQETSLAPVVHETHRSLAGG